MQWHSCSWSHCVGHRIGPGAAICPGCQIDDKACLGSGEEWDHCLGPLPPNHSSGWVPEPVAMLSTTRCRVSRRVICMRAASLSACLLLWKTFLPHTCCSAEWAHTNLAVWTWSLLSHSGYAETCSLMMGVQALTWADKHLSTVLEFLGKEISLVFHASFFPFLWLLQASRQLQQFSLALKTGCLMQQSEWNGFPSDSAITH